MVFYISDLHDKDENIITYTGRPFANTTDMHTKLVENWNSVVKYDDTVYLLGDIGDYSILKELNGNIIIVCGNHDDYNNLVKFTKRMNNIYVSKYPIFIEPVLLSHEPVTYISSNSPYINIHGHIHDGVYGRVGSWQDGKRHFNVSVENIGYKPISQEEIMKSIGY